MNRLSVLSSKGGSLNITSLQEWKDETKEICSICTDRLQNTDAVFEIMKQNIKNKDEYKKFKKSYKGFINELKRDWEEVKFKEEDFFDSSPKAERRRKDIEVFNDFNNGNGNERVNKSYSKFQNWAEKARIAFRGGEDDYHY